MVAKFCITQLCKPTPQMFRSLAKTKITAEYYFKIEKTRNSYLGEKYRIIDISLCRQTVEVQNVNTRTNSFYAIYSLINKHIFNLFKYLIYKFWYVVQKTASCENQKSLQKNDIIHQFMTRWQLKWLVLVNERSPPYSLLLVYAWWQF